MGPPHRSRLLPERRGQGLLPARRARDGAAPRAPRPHDCVGLWLRLQRWGSSRKARPGRARRGPAGSAGPAARGSDEPGPAGPRARGPCLGCAQPSRFEGAPDGCRCSPVRSRHPAASVAIARLGAAPDSRPLGDRAGSRGCDALRSANKRLCSRAGPSSVPGGQSSCGATASARASRSLAAAPAHGPGPSPLLPMDMTGGQRPRRELPSTPGFERPHDVFELIRFGVRRRPRLGLQQPLALRSPAATPASESGGDPASESSSHSRFGVQRRPLASESSGDPSLRSPAATPRFGVQRRPLADQS